MGSKRRIAHAQIVGVIAQRVKKERLSRGLSQYALANKCQLNLNYISKIERGEIAIGVDTLSRLASGLGIEISILIKTESKVEVRKDDLAQELVSKVRKFASRGDEAAIRSLLVLVGLSDAELARRRRST
jgi:transcriptional regulator with XRE-family HTH domain